MSSLWMETVSCGHVIGKMSLRKYQSVEKVEVLSPKEQEKIAANLKKLGKTSAVDLSSEDRRRVLDS